MTTEKALVPVEGPVEPKFVVSADMKADCDELLDMLTYRRLAGSKTERRFIKKFIRPLEVEQDKFGNLYKKIGANPQIMWSSHTDTVHTQGGMLELGFANQQVGVSCNDYSDCLGADDGAGIWLMVQMIRAGRPGLYIFHRQEEGGRKGSQYIAKANPDLLTGVRFAVALDRKEYNSIITHQMSSRCCSEEFSKSLGEQIGMDYKSDPTGSYTDTASYVDLIGECTNLSVGYESAHSRYERLDLSHIFKLRDALLKVDANKLTEKRKPGEKEYRTYTSSYDDFGSWEGYGGTGRSYHGHNGYHGKSWWQREKEREEQNKSRVGTRVNHGNSYDSGRAYGSNDTRDDEYDFERATSHVDLLMMEKMVKFNPEAVVDLLDQYDIGYEELRDHILEMNGVVVF